MQSNTEVYSPTHAEMVLPTPHIRAVEGSFDIRSIQFFSFTLLKEYFLLRDGVPQDQLVGMTQYEENKKVAVNSITDSRTGLLNNRGLEMWLDRYSPQHFGVIFCDGKDFGRFNKKYGHHIGDKIIQTIGEYFASRFRTSGGQSYEEEKRLHSHENDVVALNRFGGDEFLAVLDLDTVNSFERERVLQSAQARLTGFSIWVHDEEVRILGDDEARPASGFIEYIELDSASMLGEKGQKTVEEYRDLLDAQVSEAKRARRLNPTTPVV